MLKKLATLIGTLASLVLIFCILFTALQVTMNADFVIEQEYKKLSLAHDVGMNQADVIASCNRLIDYMEGNVDSIDIMVTVNGEQTLMYTDPQEVSHMVDVRLLYQQIRTYRDYGVLLALVLYLLAALISIRTAPHSLAAGYCCGAFTVLLAAGFIGTWAALDFTSFWTFFHQTLFWNDDWLFPPSSRMIQILPEQFFSDIILYFLAAALVVIVLLLIICLMLLSSERKQKKAAREEYISRKKAARAAMKEKAAGSEQEAAAPAGSQAAPVEAAEEPAPEAEAPAPAEAPADAGESAEAQEDGAGEEAAASPDGVMEDTPEDTPVATEKDPESAEVEEAGEEEEPAVETEAERT